MNLRRKNGFLFLFIFASIYFSIPFILADTTYTFEVESGNDIIWEITKYNEAAITLLETNEDYSFGGNTEKGLQIEWDIDEVDSYSGVDTDYWDVSYYYSEGDDLRDNTTEGDWHYVYVAEDPVILADDWFDGNDLYEYTIVFIPVDVEDYLEEFTAEDGSGVFTSKGNVLTINHTLEGHHDTIIIEYNDDGIEEKYQIYYDDLLAYEYELMGVYGEEIDDYLIVVVVIIVIAVFAGIIVLVAVAKYNMKQKTTPPVSVQRIPPGGQPIQPTQMPPPPAAQAVTVIGYCEYCGAERDSDAVFCPGCGQKF